jgi:hypothetical protein
MGKHVHDNYLSSLARSFRPLDLKSKGKVQVGNYPELENPQMKY